jgi:hypothetical protein
MEKVGECNVATCDVKREMLLADVMRQIENENVDSEQKITFLQNVREHMWCDGVDVITPKYGKVQGVSIQEVIDAIYYKFKWNEMDGEKVSEIINNTISKIVFEKRKKQEEYRHNSRNLQIESRFLRSLIAEKKENAMTLYGWIPWQYDGQQPVSQKDLKNFLERKKFKKLSKEKKLHKKILQKLKCWKNLVEGETTTNVALV